MRRQLKALSGLVKVLTVAVAVASVAVGAAAGPAAAAGALPAAGQALTLSPAYGNQFVLPTLQTSSACPAGSDTFYVRLYGGATGSQMPDAGQLMKEPGSIDMSTSAPFSSQTAFNFKDTAADAGVTTLAGSYVVQLVCQTELSDVLRTFTATVTFSTPTFWTTPGATAPTTTSLGASPAGGSTSGSAVTLTATIATSALGAPAPSGTVTFSDGGTPIGSAPTAGGVASIATSALGVGAHSLSASFAGAGWASSSSGTLAHTVQGVISPPPPPPPAPAFLSLGTPTLIGAVRVDSTITCSVTATNATGVSYAWTRGGAVISGAVSATRKATGADLGKLLGCRVTATGNGGPTTTSSATAKVSLGIAPRATTRPSVGGTAKVGKKLTARLGTWTPAPSSHLTTWLRDGKAIKGATKRTYVLTRADKGHKVTVRVVARKTYHLSGKAVAAAVKVR